MNHHRIPMAPAFNGRARRSAAFALSAWLMLTAAAVPQEAMPAPAGAAQAETPGIAEEVPPDPGCFDVALVASAPRYRWLPVGNVEGIILRAPVRITFDVEEVMAGRHLDPKVTVTASLHTRYGSRIRYFLLYLRRDGPGRYRIVDYAPDIVRGTNGDFVEPMTGPADPAESPYFPFFPKDYEKMLRPIHYRAADAWWLWPEKGEERKDRNSTAELPPWSIARNGGIVALRGIRVEDLVKAAGPRRCR